jgi:hypothetical protein
MRITKTVRTSAIALLCLAIVSAAHAGTEERTLFVQPAAAAASQDVGNWGVTANGSGTHFGFTVPADAVGISSVVVVTIGKATKEYTFDQSLSVANDGDPQDAVEIDILGTAANSVIGIVDELDVTGIFGTATAGDYLSLSFSAAPATAIHVVGLRFGYQVASTVGPPGDPGPPGPPGPTGPTGPAGGLTPATKLIVQCVGVATATSSGPAPEFTCPCPPGYLVLTGGVICREGTAIRSSRPTVALDGWLGSCEAPCLPNNLESSECPAVPPDELTAACVVGPPPPPS